MVSSKARPAYLSPFTTGEYTGWADPFEKTWDWLDGFDMRNWQWVADAACAAADPELFFLSDAMTNRSVLQRLCEPCPVRAACLEHALLNDEHGWWGGTTRRERLQLLKGS